MKKAIRAIVQNIEEDGSVYTYETTVCAIEDYYKELKCDLFDVMYWSINGITVSVYCDDEGTLKRGNYGRYILNEKKERLVPLFGNLLILGGVDDEGETLELDSRISIGDVARSVELAGGMFATLITK